MKLESKRFAYAAFYAPALAMLVLMIVSANVFAGAPSYLNEMPSVKRVLSEVRGRDALDTAAKQCGVFDQLISIMGVFEGSRQFSNNEQTPNERRLRRMYDSAANKINDSIQKQLNSEKNSGKSTNTPWAKWIRKRWTYSQDTAYVLSAFFSQHWQSQYRAALLRQTQLDKEYAFIQKSQSNDNETDLVQNPEEMTSATGFAFFLITLIFPLVLLVPIVIFLSRFHINQNATKLSTAFRSWKLTSTTGRLVDYQTHTSVFGGGGYSVGNSITPVYINSVLHEDLRLELLSGKSRDFHLENFNFSPKIGDIVSFYSASKQESKRIIYALNHTTESMSYNPQALFAISSGGSLSQPLKIIAMIFFVFICVIIGILMRFYVVILWGFFPLSIWLLRARNVKKIPQKRAQALWSATTTEVQKLMRASLPS